MNVDNKLPLFRHYMSDSGCGTKGSKTGTLDTGVASTEQKSVSLGLAQDEENKNAHKNSSKNDSKDSKDEERNKRNHNLLFLKNSNSKVSDEDQEEKNESLKHVRKLLNLI